MRKGGPIRRSQPRSTTGQTVTYNFADPGGRAKGDPPFGAAVGIRVEIHGSPRRHPRVARGSAGYRRRPGSVSTSCDCAQAQRAVTALPPGSGRNIGSAGAEDVALPEPLVDPGGDLVRGKD